MFKLIGKLNNLIFGFMQLRSEADRIKADPEKAEKSKRFGVRSIVNTIISSVFIVIFMWLIKIFCDSGLYELLFSLLMIAFLIFIVLLAITGPIRGIFYAVLQLSINKKKIGYVALTLAIVLHIIAIGAAVLIFMSTHFTLFGVQFS